MKNVAFDTSKDILILGGDNCDRGADSEHVLTYLDNPWVYSVQGNHESLFTGAYEEGWQGPCTNCLLQNGGMWVLGVDQAKLQDIYHVFKSLPTAIELITHEERIGVMHAQCPYNNWDEMLKMTDPEWKWDGDNTSQWARDIYDIGKSVYVKGGRQITCWAYTNTIWICRSARKYVVL
jgi:serine/threonine protein phosphatase 1